MCDAAAQRRRPQAFAVKLPIDAYRSCGSFGAGYALASEYLPLTKPRLPLEAGFFRGSYGQGRTIAGRVVEARQW